MAFLEIQNVSIAYDSKTVVKNVGFTVERGEIIVLLGASGDGKTSLLKGIGGFLPLKTGKINLEGNGLKDASEKLIPGHEKIRLVNQDFNLDDHHTVEENIRLKLLAFNKEYQLARIKTLLNLTGLNEVKDQKAILLSGGQKQRLAIARALADEPEVLLLDEPFNQLDFQTKSRISKHIKAYLKEHEIAAIMVTHNGVEAIEWGDKVVYLQKGKVKRMDAPMNFFEKPQSLIEASFFGKVNCLDLDGEKHYFRPSFFSDVTSRLFNQKIKANCVSKEFLGWYSAYTFSYEGQSFELNSTSDISELKEIYLKTFQLNA